MPLYSCQFPAAVPLTLPMPEPVPGCAPVGLASWALGESGLSVRTMPVPAALFFAGGITSAEDVLPAPEGVVMALALVAGAWEPAALCAKAAVTEIGATSSAADRQKECRRVI
jgi:hypothetical protein